MIKRLFICLLLVNVFICLRAQTKQYVLPALSDTVEILTDLWGVPHIYANSEADLFFAQGFYAAKDRLFQFEIWRRQATGTLSEILGERALDRDIGARLFQFRGDMNAELNYYHDNGKEIIEAYVDGVNTYISSVLNGQDTLPMEFRLLGIQPDYWTPEVVVSRHQGLLGNIDNEIEVAKAVHALGEEKVKELLWLHPKEPNLSIDSTIDINLFDKDIIAPYHAFRNTLEFTPDDIIVEAGNQWEEYDMLHKMDKESYVEWVKDDINNMGSNNWVIDGSLTESGYPIMANDPHRKLSTPSLRYMAHLIAPGWNVIGGGEPVIPGISIGHNEHGAWGLTVYRTDAEDLYVYQLNPENPDEYLYNGEWELLRFINDTIYVKDRSPEYVRHAYTRHGPVTYIDEANHIAYAMRCGWLEPGGSPYLASLRMDQAKSWEEFRNACNYSHIPGENMVWADNAGNIGWQAVGIAPIREGWSGLVPVPGDGRYEWAGYLPIIAKPSSFNPTSGIINTSNENVTPQDYPYWNAVGYEWSDPYRGDRVREVLESGRRHSMADMAALQTDYLSIPARQLIPLLKHIETNDQNILLVINMLQNWDFQLTPDSREAAIYVEWEEQIKELVISIKIPGPLRSIMNIQMKRIIEWLYLPGSDFGNDPLTARNTILLQSLYAALINLTHKLGQDMSKWTYGGDNYKHVMIKHPLSNAVNPDIRDKLDVGPAPRGGYSLTVNNTGSSDNQPSGGSFRMIVDTGNWDHCLATNSPGQNGNPDHPHYRNLFELWAGDQYFPLFYSRDKVELVMSYTTILIPE